MLLLFMQERLLYRLSISKYNSRFILKGGLLILSTTNIKTRPTRDIDFLGQNISNDLQEIKNIIKEVCQIEINDGVSFDPDSITVERITEGADYEGVRIKIQSYLGKARKTIQLDIGFGDIIFPGVVELEYPAILDFENPKLKSYSFESVIAEKFEAMLRLSLINSRMKDFYDIYLLSDIKSFDGRVLQEAIFSTLQRRGTPIEKEHILFTDKFVKDKTTIRQWKAYLKRIGKEQIDFSEVMDRLKMFLFPIYNHILKEEEFLRRWNDDNYCWCKYREK